MFHAMNDEWKGIGPAPQGLRDRFIATDAGKLLHPPDADRHEAHAMPLARLLEPQHDEHQCLP